MRLDTNPGGIGARLAAFAIVVAPFVALLYRVEAGLVVMAFALGAVSFLLYGAIGAAPPQARRRLRLVLGCNAVLAVACLAGAGWLIAQ